MLVGERGFYRLEKESCAPKQEEGEREQTLDF